MQQSSDARQVRLFCFEHGRPTTDYAGATIFCDRDERDGHVLARDFPFADDWEYCCDCECFYTLEQARKVRAADGQDAARCPACGRQSIRHYLCAGCKVISHKSGEKVRAVYSITATGLIRPSCPGCLTAASAAVQEHECHLLGLGFTTSRASCPFCKLAILPDAPAAVVREAPARSGEAAAAAAPTAKPEPAPSPRPAAPRPAKPNATRSTTAGRSVPAAQSTPVARASDAGRAAKGSPTSADTSGKRTTTPQQPTASDKPKWPKARRALLSAGVLVLLLAASAAAFYLYLKRETQSPVSQESRSMSVADAQKAVDAARSKLVPEERLENARRAADAARAKAALLKDRWDKQRAFTIRLGKNPDDPEQAPVTTRVKLQYMEAEAEAKAKSHELEELTDQDRLARKELKDAQDALPGAKEPATVVDSRQPTPVPMQEQSMLAAVAAWLPVALAALALIISCTFALLVRNLHWENAMTARDVNSLRHQLMEQSDKLSRQVIGLKDVLSKVGGLGNVSDKLARLEADVAKVQDMLRPARRAEPAAESPRSATPKDDGAAAARAYRGSYAAAPAEEVIDFPIAAGSFLKRMPEPRQIITYDPLKGIFVRDPEGHGQLVLVRDGSVPGGALYVIPRLTLFRSQQDFYNYYERLYDCGRPSSGEVWIVEPALVRSVDGGWALLEKGVLEIDVLGIRE